MKESNKGDKPTKNALLSSAVSMAQKMHIACYFLQLSIEHHHCYAVIIPPSTANTTNEDEHMIVYTCHLITVQNNNKIMQYSLIYSIAFHTCFLLYLFPLNLFLSPAILTNIVTWSYQNSQKRHKNMGKSLILTDVRIVFKCVKFTLRCEWIALYRQYTSQHTRMRRTRNQLTMN